MTRWKSQVHLISKQAPNLNARHLHVILNSTHSLPTRKERRASHFQTWSLAHGGVSVRWGGCQYPSTQRTAFPLQQGTHVRLPTLVSTGCYHKMPKDRGFPNRTLCLTAVEVASPRSRFRQILAHIAAFSPGSSHGSETKIFSGVSS
jgi:hypothetical protein